MISGTEFNKTQRTCVKLVSRKDFHRSTKCKSGLNEDTKGILFCDINKMSLWFDNGYGHKNDFNYLRNVTIPDDAVVVVDIDKDIYRSDKVILGEKHSILTLDEWNNYSFCENIVRLNGLALGFILRYNENYCKKLCSIAVNQNGMALQFVYKKNQTSDICIDAITQNPMALKFVLITKTSQMKFLAIEQHELALQHGLALQHVFNKSNKIILTAVKQNGLALQYVPNIQDQTLEICMAAVNQNKFSINYIIDPILRKKILSYSKSLTMENIRLQIN